MSTIKRIITSFMAMLVIAAAVVGFTQPVSAIDPLESACTGDISTTEICTNRTTEKLFGANSFWTRLINTMLLVIGSIAVLMMVVGGLRYVISGGDASQTKSAKDTILYAIVGVVIAIMSYAIVNFVIVRLVG